LPQLTIANRMQGKAGRAKKEQDEFTVYKYCRARYLVPKAGSKPNAQMW